MRWKEINEAPIADFGTSGDLDKEGSFRASDLKAIRNPKWVEKVHDAFSKTEFDFNLYLHNAEDAILNLGGKYYDARSIAELRKFHGLASMPDVAKVIGFQPPNWQQSITVLLVENEGDERFPLTPWMLAHRVAHAFLYADRSPEATSNQDIANFVNEYDREFSKFVREIDIPMSRLLPPGAAKEAADLPEGEYMRFMAKHYAKMLGQFRSAREGTIRDAGEFKVECFTQYLVQGAIKFNRPELPGEPRVPKEEPNPLLAKAREYNNRWPMALADDFAKKVVRSVPRPYDGYVAIDANGQAMASFGGGKSDPERTAQLIQKYEAQGLKIEQIVSKPGAQARYDAYLKKLAQVTDQYSEWRQEGLLRGPKSSTTDRLDVIITDAEDRLNATIRRILIRCIGRALIL